MIVESGREKSILTSSSFHKIIKPLRMFVEVEKRMRCGFFQKCVSVRHYKYGDAKYCPYSGSVAEIPASVLWCRIETETSFG